MIDAFLQHHLERAKRGEIKQAIRHCHVRGLHSIVLHDQPENRIRMFYASPEHGMHWSGEQKDRMPLAIHSHHCDVKLIGVCGAAESRSYCLDETGDIELTKCRFDSAIAANGKLTSRGAVRSLRSLGVYTLTDTHLLLDADELHTVTVPVGEEAAWIVIEGAEDPDYLSVCYTNYPHWSPDYLYRSAERDEVTKWLARVIELRGASESG